MKYVIIFVCFSIISSEVNSLVSFKGCFEFREISPNSNKYHVSVPCVSDKSPPCLNNTTYTAMFPQVESMKYECKENASNFELESDFLLLFSNVERLDVSFIGAKKMQFSNGGVTMANIGNFIASHNNLERVPKEIILHMPNLYDIDLSHNQIRKIYNDDFNQSKNLWTLYLSNNHIIDIEMSAFSKLSNIRYLFLENNTINTESALTDRFKNNTNLRKLYLEGNAVKSFKFSWLSSEAAGTKVLLPIEIEKLDLSCSIDEKCQPKNSPYTVIDLKNVRTFNASRNSFDKMGKLLQNVNKGLEVLDLSWNDIQILHYNNLGRFSGLKHLNLSHANIFSIRYNAFEYPHNLLSLDLSYNNLTKADFYVPSSLLLLNLEGNQLVSLEEIAAEQYIFDTIALSSLAINKNKFKCEYLEGYLKQWSIQRPKWAKKVNFFNNITTQDANVHGIDCITESDTTSLNPNAGEVEETTSTQITTTQKNEPHNSMFYIEFFYLFNIFFHFISLFQKCQMIIFEMAIFSSFELRVLERCVLLHIWIGSTGHYTGGLFGFIFLPSPEKI